MMRLPVPWHLLGNVLGEALVGMSLLLSLALPKTLFQALQQQKVSQLPCRARVQILGPHCPGWILCSGWQVCCLSVFTCEIELIMHICYGCCEGGV